MAKSQTLAPYLSNKKWGYVLNNSIIIQPQYDTAFVFDKNNQIALVGNKNNSKKTLNTLTGEEIATVDYYFINKYNSKIKVSENLTDSSTIYPYQEELQLNYLNNDTVFKVVYNHKIFLLKKRGIQFTQGYDNIYKSETGDFYFTELYIKNFNEVLRAKGLLDVTGKTIIKCENKEIRINIKDSVIYCCSTLFNTQSSDEVYDFTGKIIYTNKHHITFSTKNIHVYRLYEPKEVYVIQNDLTKNSTEIEGSEFYNLKNDKVFIVDKTNCFLVNLLTGKKQKINKDLYLKTMYNIIGL